MNEHKPTGLLHIYGQREWHEDAFIVGNVEALKALRAGIDKLLATGGKGLANIPDGYTDKVDMDFWVNDGEGYPLHIILINGDWHTEKWENLMMPYYDEIASDKDEESIKPWELN